MSTISSTELEKGPLLHKQNELKRIASEPSEMKLTNSD